MLSMTATTRLLCGWLTLAGWLSAAPGMVRAGEEDEAIRVAVVAILASAHEPAKVDPKLLHIAKEIQKNQPHLKSFAIKRTTCMALTIGKKENYPLVDELVAEVTVLEKPAKDGKVRLMVKAPKVAEITYRTCCDKFFPILTGYQTQKQERLIIAVMVPPCP